MKASEVTSPEDILTFIEGTLNDYENHLIDKREAMDNILDLLEVCVNEKIKRVTK